MDALAAQVRACLPIHAKDPISQRAGARAGAALDALVALARWAADARNALEQIAATSIDNQAREAAREALARLDGGSDG